MQVKQKENGFTLIELLVVIAIISLLVSILLPSLQTAKDLAKKAMCSTNLKHLGLAMMMYAADYNNDLPNYRDSDGTGTYWINKLSEEDGEGYIPAGSGNTMGDWGLSGTGSSIFRCPSVEHSGCTYGVEIINADWLLPFYHDVSFFPPSDDPNHHVNMERIPFPGEIMMVAESQHRDDWDTHWPAFAYMPIKGYSYGPAGVAYYQIDTERHNFGANTCYYDGHVDWLEEDKYLSDYAIYGADMSK